MLIIFTTNHTCVYYLYICLTNYHLVINEYVNRVYYLACYRVYLVNLITTAKLITYWYVLCYSSTLLSSIFFANGEATKTTDCRAEKLVK